MRLIPLLVGLWSIPILCLASLYAEPPGGWVHAYDGAVLPTSVGWAHNNAADNWDGSGLNSGGFGGAEVQVAGNDSYLRIRDQLNGGSPNQKLFFHRVLDPGGADPLEAGGSGVTLHLRTRLPTNAVGNGFYSTPNGHPLSTGGLSGSGMFEFFSGFRNPTDTTKSIGLSLLDSGWQLNGPSDSQRNTIVVNDPTQFQEIYVTIGALNNGTHQVSFFENGSLTPQIFEVDPGGHNIEGPPEFSPSIGMGISSTGGDGEFDIDFFNVSFSTSAPSLIIPEPSSLALWLIGGALLSSCRRWSWS